MDYEKLCMNCMREKKSQAEKCQYCGFDPQDYRSESSALPPFTILSGRYLLGREIGEGGFGITYLALDLILERRVAIKEFFMQDMMYRTKLDAVTVSTANGNEEEMYRSSRAKFEKEAKILAHLNNMPGIVQVYDCFLENGTIYIAMEYLEGKTLGEYIKSKGGRLSVEETIRILLPIMQSLEKIHKEGIIHRDISPDNIKFAEDGVLKLYDFGGAKLEKGGAASKVVYMKPGYTPLEQYSANGNQGPWTDVYAMAATMYYCISGKRLPEAPDRSVRKNQGLFESGDVKVSKQVEKVLSKALELYYEDRYQTMEEFSKALQEKDNRKKFVIPGIAAGAVLVIGVSGVLFATRGQQDKKGQEFVEATALKETETQTERVKRKKTETQTETVSVKETQRQIETEKTKETEKQTEKEKAKDTEKQAGTAKETEKQKSTYQITVAGGSGSGKHAEDEEIVLKADDRTDEGYEFVSWKITTGSVKTEDSTAAETAAVVLSSDAEIEAEYQETAEKLVEDGDLLFYGKGKYEEAVSKYQKAADRGSGMAQERLGWCYETGCGVIQNTEKAEVHYKKAAEILKKAAEQGDAEAQAWLGSLYSVGEGVAQSAEKAVEWWRKAAYQGNVTAQSNLAGSYLYGEGVEKDSKKAAEWFEKAAIQGDAYSRYWLGRMYLEGDGIKKNKEKGTTWIRKAIDAAENSGTDSLVQYFIGEMYLKGKEVEKNEILGKELLQKAAEAGIDEAQELLDESAVTEAETEAETETEAVPVYDIETESEMETELNSEAVSETGCEEGFLNGHLYMIFDNDKTYHEAEAYCESLGGHLATIHNQEENDYLYRYMVSQGYASAYFGFSDEENEGEWKWVNGEPAFYTNWADGEPNGGRDTENYAQFYWEYLNGKWNDGSFGLLDVPDSGGSAYICEWDTMEEETE